MALYSITNFKTDVVKRLKDAKAIIEKPEHWTRGWLAANKTTGKMANIMDANCFCTMGALYRAAPSVDRNCLLDTKDLNIHEQAEEYLRQAMNGCGIAHFNDKVAKDHSDIMAAFDRAITLASTDL